MIWCCKLLSKTIVGDLQVFLGDPERKQLSSLARLSLAQKKRQDTESVVVPVLGGGRLGFSTFLPKNRIAIQKMIPFTVRFGRVHAAFHSVPFYKCWDHGPGRVESSRLRWRVDRILGEGADPV